LSSSNVKNPPDGTSVGGGASDGATMVNLVLKSLLPNGIVVILFKSSVVMLKKVLGASCTT
jgi:hypothetical protein